MKKYIVLFFVALIVIASSCEKLTYYNDSSTPTSFPTLPKPCLTNEAGWQLAEGTITPAYEMSTGEMISDLMDYLYVCEKDDEIFFDENGAERINTNVKCAEGEGLQDDEVAALWHFDNEEDPQVLYMQLPFFYGETGNALSAEQENCKILNLTKDKLEISYTFNVGYDTYTFTMTYRNRKIVASY